MRSALSMLTGLALLLGVGEADATVSVAIDLTHQRMHVAAPDANYDWPISSARSGFYTPGGSFAPTHLERMHYSKKYHMSPMPYSIFFRGGFAIHGTYAVGELGRPASHGCVRLSPAHAATLYGMVQAEGARISISGTPPASHGFRRSDEARRDAPPGAERRRIARARRNGVPPSFDAGDGLYAEAPARRRAYRGYAAAYPYADRARAYPRQAYPSQAYPSQAYPSQTYPSYAYPYGARPPESYTRDYVYTPPASTRSFYGE